MNRSYYLEINYLRGFAILAVISIHISTNFTKMQFMNPLTIIYMTIDCFSHFSVPAFIFISGFVLYNKYNSSLKINKFYKNRLRTVIPPYIIFSTIYIIFSCICLKLTGKTVSLNASILLHQYLTGGAYYHLWFFILIIELYILYPLILEIYNYCTKNNLISLFIIITFILSVKNHNHEVLKYLFYFTLGMYVNNNYEKLESKSQKYIISMFIILIGCTFLKVCKCMNSYLSYDVINIQIWPVFLNVIYYTTTFLVLLYVSKNLARYRRLHFIDMIGTYSFPIYLIHALFLKMFTMILAKFRFDWNDMSFFPVMFVLVLGMSIFSIEIVQKLPGSKYIIGSVKSKHA